MMRYGIWTGDTTTHGGILADGEITNYWGGQHLAVLVGHKFWCPKCLCWSEFIEGTPRYIIQGKRRVLEGYRASCGAKAIHSQGFNFRVEDFEDSMSEKALIKKNEIRVTARQNQPEKGNYSHKFNIINSSPNPVEYIVYGNGELLDVGTALKRDFGYSASTEIITSEPKLIAVAVKAPRVKIG